MFPVPLQFPSVTCHRGAIEGTVPYLHIYRMFVDANVSFMICTLPIVLYSVSIWANPVGRAMACRVLVWCRDLGPPGFTRFSSREQRRDLQWTVNADCAPGVMTQLVFLWHCLKRTADVVKNALRRLMLL